MTAPDRIAHAARLLGLSGEAMARALGVHLRTYRRWISGDLTPPPAIWGEIIATMRAHALVLLVAADELAAWPPPEQQKPGRKRGERQA
jgi:hypothetical protein